MADKKVTLGFTLIELLVVISIISLLASITLSSLNSARGQAAVAAGQRFDQQLTSKFYTSAFYLVGDVVGGTAQSSGTKKLEGVLTDINIVEGIKGDAYEFTQSTSRVTFQHPTSYQNQLANNQYTLSAWIKPNQLLSEQVMIGNNRGDSLVFGLKEGKIWLRFNDREARSVPIVTLDDWQHVAVSYEWPGSDQDIRFFHNGSLVEQEFNELSGYNAELVVSHRPEEIYIGHTNRGNLDFAGVIDEPKLYYGSI